MPTESRRARAIRTMDEVMRDFMARAVLFQDAVARSVGLNGTDMQALSLLVSQGPATPGELAERTGLTAGGAITAVVDRLERSGFAARARDPQDRRRVIVTADLEQLFARVGPTYARVSQRWGTYLETLTDDQIEFANEVLRQAAEVNRLEIELLRSS